MSTKLSYIPEPFERAYFEGLFNAADTQRNGSIGGAEAVRFFSTSKLPIDALKSVWTLADQPASNYLDRPKFAVAVRLIQLLQNGQKGQGPNLAAPNGVTLRPVFFEGVSGGSVPMPQGPAGPNSPPRPGPPPQQQQQPPRTITPQPPPQQQRQGPPPPQQQHRQGPPPPQQQQHQGPPPPQKHHQQPPPPQHQQQHHPPTPGSTATPSSRPPPQQQQQGAPSTALVMQDPYTMTPSEQARFEQLFPDYEKGGFVYGAEAVALFSKSGIPQPQLAAIWNMVDTPVDNRLDRLEFTMAMHLIVCVSKKNLPLPGGLPMSLKQLKAQQSERQQPPTPSPVQQPQMQQQQQPPPPQNQQQYMQQSTQSPPPQMQYMQQQHASPPPMQIQPPAQSPPPQMQYMQPPSQSPPPQMHHMQQQQMSMPSPPRARTSPIRIPSPPAMQMHQPPQMQAPISPMRSPAREMQAPPSMSGMQGPPPLQAPQTLDISDAFEGLNPTSVSESAYTSMNQSQIKPMYGGKNYDMDTSVSSEVRNFNMGTQATTFRNSPSPEPQYQSVPEPMEQPKTTEQLKQSYNMGAASEELVKLKAILQKLQAENISLKASMSSLNEEEREIQKELNATISEISKLSTELTTLRAKVLASKSRLLEATSELKAAKEKKSVITDLIAEASATKDAIDEAYEGIENANKAVHEVMAPPPAPTIEADLFGFDSPAPSTYVPSYQQQPVYQQQPTDNEDTHREAQQHQQPQYGAPPSHSYDELGHARTGSTLSAFDGVMGGEDLGMPGLPKEVASTHQQPALVFSPPTPQASNTSEARAPQQKQQPALVYSAPPLQPHVERDEITSEIIEEMKKQLKEAEDVAHDANGSMTKIKNEFSKLAKDTEEAEAKLQAHVKQSEGKKKGLFGGGKKAAKEGERIAQEIKEHKDKLAEVQAQLKDAEKLANETKKEADRLRGEVEEAEIGLAAAASMEGQTPPAPTNGYQSSGPNYGGDDSYGVLNFGSPMGGDGGKMAGSQDRTGFNPSVMGSGGVDIPTPSAAPSYGNTY